LKKHEVIPKIIPEKDRPRCTIPGCTKSGAAFGYYQKDGTPLFRKYCHKHVAIKYGTNGWDYKIYRKDYCENIDGRLGFNCTTNIIEPELQLDADHIDGNPLNNDPKNIQTLCKCCHAIKTNQSQDYLTLGRRSLKKQMGGNELIERCI